MGNQMDIKNESKQKRIIDMPYNVCKLCSKKTKQQNVCKAKCITFWPPFDDKFCKCKNDLTCYNCLKRHGKEKLCHRGKFQDPYQINPEDGCKDGTSEDEKNMTICKDNKRMTTCENDIIITKHDINKISADYEDVEIMTFYVDDKIMKSIKNDKKKISELNCIMCSKV